MCLSRVVDRAIRFLVSHASLAMIKAPLALLDAWPRVPAGEGGSPGVGLVKKLAPASSTLLLHCT